MREYIVGFWNGVKNNTPVLITIVAALVAVVLMGMYYAAHYGLFEWLPEFLGGLL